MNWIFQSGVKDGLFLFVPFFLGTLYCFVAGEYHFAWFALLVNIIDQTHVVSTSWRTVFNKRQRKLLTIGVPLSVVLVIGFLVYIEFSYLWHIITYIGVIHIIRQNYGVIRWYHKKNCYFDKSEEYFFYLFSFAPFLLLHFRPDLILSLFENGVFYSYPSAIIFERGMNIYLALVFLWFCYDVLIRKHFYKSVGSKLFILMNSLFTYFALTMLTTNAQVIDTLLFAHAIHYLALNSLSLEKTSRPGIGSYAAMVVAGLGLLYIYHKYPSPLENVRAMGAETSALLALIMAVYYLPILSHYTYDAFIWRSSDVDAKRIYD